MTKRFSDEQILSYVMNDASKDLQDEINLLLKTDLDLRNEIAAISQIHKQVKLAPAECYVPVKHKNIWWRLAPTCGLLLISFFIGLLIESRFVLLGSINNFEQNINMEKEISKPIHFDDERKTALL